jgi:hypothetical protein
MSSHSTLLVSELLSSANYTCNTKCKQAPDPTGGYVRYVTLEEANDKAMISNDSDIIRLAAYWDGSYPPNSGFTGRPSVRVESKATFTEGLFVLDLLHIPWGCGAWPAFWTGGLGDWPAGGEIGMS